MGEHLLIGIDFEKFFRGEIDPDTFEASLKRVIGSTATLEDIDVAVGSGPAGEPPEEYAYFVTTEEQGIRPKLLGIPGVATVFSFGTKSHTG